MLSESASKYFAPGGEGDDYAERVRGWYRERGLRVPADDGELVRAILRGLAAAYRETMDDLATAIGRAPAGIVIGGGGVKNHLLCEFTREACGIETDVGTSEATALGNALVQAVATGEIGVDDLRRVSLASAG